MLLKILLFALSVNLFTCSLYEASDDETIAIRLFTDAELEEELRRRELGGPWEPQDAVTIFNTAVDLLHGGSQGRTRRFSAEAQVLIELVTNQVNPVIEPDTEADRTEVDPSYYDDPIFIDGRLIALSTMQKIVDMADGLNGQKRRSSDSIERLYSWFRPYMLTRFRKRVASGGTRRDKLRAIDLQVLNLFKQARDRKQPIHGRMLQRWALQAASQSSLEDFGASLGWLRNFKTRHGIVSRKVTIYTSRSEEAGRDGIVEKIERFHNAFTRDRIPFDNGRIWNFDQTGFNYEPSNLRILSFKGERDTSLLIDSKNKHTHSYTVQPMITRNGKLFPKLFIVLQEERGNFGPIVKAEVDRLVRSFGNIEVIASKSGKLTSELVDSWFGGTLGTAIRAVANRRSIEDEPAVLILADSWSGHSKDSQISDLKNLGAKLLRIPPQTTDKLQPLDVNFNRQLKIFYNRIMEEAHFKELIRNVTSREGILNVQSLMHSQLMSEKYKDMILYAWHNTDPAFNITELSTFPPRMVNKIQFDFDATASCQVNNCQEHAFIQCSHCGKLLCLEHFLERVCTHGFSRSKRELSCETSTEAASTEATDRFETCTKPTDRFEHSTADQLDTSGEAASVSTIKPEDPLFKLGSQLISGPITDLLHHKLAPPIDAQSSEPPSSWTEPPLDQPLTSSPSYRPSSTLRPTTKRPVPTTMRPPARMRPRGRVPFGRNG